MFFKAFRTQYTAVCANFAASGKNQEGADHGEEDDIYYERFSSFFGEDTKALFLFMRLVYRDNPPRFCMRDMSKSLQNDIGVGEKLTPTTASGNKKSKSFKLTDEGLKEAFSAPQQLTQEETNLKLSQTSFYEAQAQASAVSSKVQVLDVINKELLELVDATDADAMAYKEKLIGKKRKLMMDL